jgi:hypothetical protein
MDLFSTGYDPAEWDLVSHRSDGEYLSLSEDSDSSDSPLPNEPDHSFDSAPESLTDYEELNFLDIKMMSSFVDLNSLISQRSTLQNKKSALTPGQFHLSDRYTSQIEQLTAQIEAIQQPSVVNIHHYTPPDAAFVHQEHKARISKALSIHSADIKNKAIIPSSHSDIDSESLDNTIFHLEEEIKEKEAVVRELWKTIKMQKEEVDFLKRKRDELFEKELNRQELEVEFIENKLVKGLDDRLVISVNIKVSGYLTYTLDAQVDTGAMNSCAKHGAILDYYWQPVDISFRAINKTELKIKHIAPDFPIYIQEEKVPVTFYSFDTGSDILLGQDFANKCLPLTIGNKFVQILINGKTLKVPSKSVFETRIAVKETTT